MLEGAKVRLLFERVQHSGLQVQIEYLNDSITTGIDIFYTTAANHLSAAVSQLTEYSARNRVIYGVEAQGTSDGIYNPNGIIIDDKCIPNWSYLSVEDSKNVTAERKKLGNRLGKGGKGEKGGNPGENNNKKKHSEK